MRILYSFPHPVGRPGIGSTAFHQIQGAIAEGVEVVLYCTSLERELEGEVTVVPTLAVGGFRLPHRALGVDRAYRYHDRRVARALRRSPKSVDIVHCWPSACIHTFGAARAQHIPCVREVPNTHTRHALEAVAREASMLALDPVRGHSHTFRPEVICREEREYELADVLLVPSDFALQTFLDRGVPAEKLVLHRYGFDSSRFYPAANRNGRLPSDGLRALFVGSCEPRKGLHHALNAWFDSGACERGRFFICGDFVPGYREALAPQLEHPSVEVSPFAPDPGPLMRASDIFLFPSIEEGSAIVTYEAQACGCVLVVSNATGARVEHMRQGLVHAAGDVSMLTEHLRLLDRDRDLLSSLRTATLRVRHELSWDFSARELAAAYDRIAVRHALAT